MGTGGIVKYVIKPVTNNVQLLEKISAETHGTLHGRRYRVRRRWYSRAVLHDNMIPHTELIVFVFITASNNENVTSLSCRRHLRMDDQISKPEFKQNNQITQIISKISHHRNGCRGAA